MKGQAAFRLERGTFHGFPSLTLRNEHFLATVVPALGGRMMAFGKPQGINCLYVFDGLERKKATVSSASAMNAQELRTFRFSNPPFHYGGFKNWLSPETVWEGRPFLDLDNADYHSITQITEEQIQVSVVSPVCRETGMAFRRTFSLNRNGRSLEVEQCMFNHNNHDA